jgi:hypothetical protein
MSPHVDVTSADELRPGQIRRCWEALRKLYRVLKHACNMDLKYTNYYSAHEMIAIRVNYDRGDSGGGRKLSGSSLTSYHFVMPSHRHRSYFMQ